MDSSKTIITPPEVSNLQQIIPQNSTGSSATNRRFSPDSVSKHKAKTFMSPFFFRGLVDQIKIYFIFGVFVRCF